MQYNNHIIILYWDEFARLIVEQLLNAQKQLVVLTADEATEQALTNNYKNTNVKALKADYEDFSQLRSVNIESSAAVLINFPDDTDKLRYLIHLKNAFANIRYVVSIANPDLKETFYNTGVHYCISKDEISAKLISSYLFERDVARFSSDLLSASASEDELDMQQFKVTSENPVRNKLYGEAFDYLQKEYNALLIGISRDKNIMKLPDPATTIREGDYLILIADGIKGMTISKDFGVKEGLTDRK